MKTYLHILFFLLIVISLAFCAAKEDLQTRFPQKIKSVYYQRGIGAQEQAGNGTNFYIEFYVPLSKDIQLAKIYFQNQEASFEQVNRTIFVAHLYSKNRIPDLILDSDSIKEYGNQAPIITKPKFALKPTDALLEYKSNGNARFFKVKNPKEKPMISDPSMIKPKK